MEKGIKLPKGEKTIKGILPDALIHNAPKAESKQKSEIDYQSPAHHLVFKDGNIIRYDIYFDGQAGCRPDAQIDIAAFYCRRNNKAVIEPYVVCRADRCVTAADNGGGLVALKVGIVEIQVCRCVAVRWFKSQRRPCGFRFSTLIRPFEDLRPRLRP